VGSSASPDFRLGPDEIARRMQAAAQDSRSGRAGVIVIRDGRIALIERVRDGRQYWLLPGGGTEPGETPAQAAQREAEEELGVPVRLGPLRVLVHHPQADGTMLLHWYFGADIATDTIMVTGPELEEPAESGSYTAVWLELSQIASRTVWPAGVARLVAANRGNWSGTVVELVEPA
jgi:8-oxo-dGTP diphosphatase